MPYTQLSFDSLIERRLRSHLMTLDKLRLSSIRLHGEVRPSVRSHAKNISDEINALAAEHFNNPTVVRWCTKIQDYVKQYNLLEGVQSETVKRRSQGNG